jgi:hypothetical protein
MEMFKLGIGVFCLILALVCGSAMVVTGESDIEDMCVPMGIITLEPPDTVEDPRPAVAFNHPIHFDYNCQTCHHKWDKVSPIVGCMTTGCHDIVEAPARSERIQSDENLAVRYYKTAYHKMCITCHKEIKAQNKKLEMSGRVLTESLPNSGPTSCKGCHLPEE